VARQNPALRKRQALTNVTLSAKTSIINKWLLEAEEELKQQ
jgi:hypothetical protein